MKPRLTVDAPMSRSQLSSVKYVYVVDYKSMIGGYRTLLVNNEFGEVIVNPWDIWIMSESRHHNYGAPSLNTMNWWNSDERDEMIIQTK
jgi:hypothetical protein